MLKVKKIVTSLIVTVLSFGFLSTTISAAEATENKSTAIVQQDVKKIEQEVRFIFEEASSYKNGVVSVKDELLKMKYGKVMAVYIAEGIRQVYTNDNLLDAIRANSQDKDFWSCMGGELIGLIPGMDIAQLLSSGDFKAYIEGHAWDKLAKFLAKQIAKFGLKVNVAGIVASIAIGAGKCLIFG